MIESILIVIVIAGAFRLAVRSIDPRPAPRRMSDAEADRWLRARLAEIRDDRSHESLARRVRCPEVH